MRILYVCDATLPSTAANSVPVMKMCRAFAALGHEVTLLAKSVSRGTDLHAHYGVDQTFAIVGADRRH